jgi:hypothetical protein
MRNDNIMTTSSAMIMTIKAINLGTGGFIPLHFASRPSKFRLPAADFPAESRAVVALDDG